MESDDYKLTLAAFLTGKGYSQAFVQHFIIPMGEAVWSADPVKFNEFPARYFAQFFKNHGFLNVKDQPQWLTDKRPVEAIHQTDNATLCRSDPAELSGRIGSAVSGLC